MKKKFEFKAEYTKKGMHFSKDIQGMTVIEKLGIVKYLELELEIEAIQNIQEKQESKNGNKKQKS